MHQVHVILFLVAPVWSLNYVKRPLEEHIDAQRTLMTMLGDAGLDAMENKFEILAMEKFEPSAHVVSAWRKKSKETKLMNAKEAILPDTCKNDIRHRRLKSKECAEPWPQTKDCKKSYEIPGYRMGDLFFRNYDPGKNAGWIKFYFPESIGAKYLTQRRSVPQKGNEDWSALMTVVDSPEYVGYEHPDNDTVVVHFRGYDVLSVFANVRGGYVRHHNYYKKAAEESARLGLKKAIIVAGDHWLAQDLGIIQSNDIQGTEVKRKQLQIATTKTEEEMAEIEKIFSKAGLKVSKRQNFNADCDLVFMANSRTFVASGGSFDQLLAGLVQRKNGTILLGGSKINR